MSEVIEAAIQQFYSDQEPPPEVHVSAAPAEQQVLEEWLTQRARRKVRIVVPQRGNKKGLMELAHRNAALGYRTRFDQNATANYEALELLQVALRLPKLPRRIDCFDISTIQGSETVASMVVCEEGRMRPSEYRKFKIKDGEPGTGTGNREPGTGSRQPEWRCRRSRIPVPRSRLPDDSSTTSRRWSRWCAAAMRRCSRTADRFRI